MERQKRAQSQDPHPYFPRPNNDPVNDHYHMIMGSPTYFLFESASGYALFLGHGLNKGVDDEYRGAEELIRRFDQVFKLVAFHPFESVDDAVKQYKAVTQGIVTEQLMNFLVLNLPKEPNKGGKPCYVLALTNGHMQDTICIRTKVASVCGQFHFDIMRGFRMYMDKFIKDTKNEDLVKAQRELARSYNRQWYSIQHI